MGRKVYVIGVGMTKFEKPGSKSWDYPEMAKEAGEKALKDAGIPYDQVEQAAVGYCYGDSTCGQRAVYQLGLTGIPVYNVNNNCSTGSTALYMAKQFVEGGVADCVLALGFEKMEKGSLGAKFTDRTNPLDKQFELMVSLCGFEAAPATAQFFGNAAREHMQRYGTTAEQFAKIGHKNHRHSVNNPFSQFQDEYSLEDVLNAPMVYAPLTKLQCCPTSDGAAAAILAGEDFVKRHRLQAKAVEIAGMAMTTDFRSTFDDKSCIKLIGADMTRRAAEKVYQQSGLGPENLDVIELHDCFSANELVTYEALGLCGEGKGGELIDSGAVTYGGKVVVNPSGGLISKGHPLGATGLAQCSELVWQLRGQADRRQVPGAKAALQHNLGLGGAAVVTVYRKAELPA
jgi:sterol carrier protein 2